MVARFYVGTTQRRVFVQWQGGRCLFEVNDNHNVTRTALAKQIVRFTHQTPFPGSDQAGLVIINYNTVGTHETIQSLVIWTRRTYLVQRTNDDAA